jgi:hypothetical protein
MGVCSTHGRDENSENLKGREHSEDVAVDLEDNIKMDIRGIEWQCVDLMHLTQDRDPW